MSGMEEQTEGVNRQKDEVRLWLGMEDQTVDGIQS